jgi:hypothetical protein
MRLILLVLFIILPYFSFAQGQGQEKKFKVKIGTKEYALEELPDEIDLPQRLNRVWIKVDKEQEKDNKDNKDKDKKDKGKKDRGKIVSKVIPNKINNHELDNTFTMLVGEEERSFPVDGLYYECKFTHDIKDLVCYILDENRIITGKPFVFKKRK